MLSTSPKARVSGARRAEGRQCVEPIRECDAFGDLIGQWLGFLALKVRDADCVSGCAGRVYVDSAETSFGKAVVERGDRFRIAGCDRNAVGFGTGWGRACEMVRCVVHRLICLEKGCLARYVMKLPEQSSKQELGTLKLVWS